MSIEVTCLKNHEPIIPQGMFQQTIEEEKGNLALLGHHDDITIECKSVNQRALSYWLHNIQGQQ